jgi:hypothetical protein
VALAGLIPISSMADISELPPKEATENMIYHFLDVSVFIFCFGRFISFKRFTHVSLVL